MIVILFYSTDGRSEEPALAFFPLNSDQGGRIAAYMAMAANANFGKKAWIFRINAVDEDPVQVYPEICDPADEDEEPF